LSSSGKQFSGLLFQENFFGQNITLYFKFTLIARNVKKAAILSRHLKIILCFRTEILISGTIPSVSGFSGSMVNIAGRHVHRNTQTTFNIYHIQQEMNGWRRSSVVFDTWKS